MTLIYSPGSIFESPAQVLVNPVNVLEHTMGKGLAKQFYERYGVAYFDEYVHHCQTGRCRIGRPSLSEIRHRDGNRIMNFATKESWRDPSRLEWIEQGLEYIAQNYARAGIRSMAFPALGCGLGGLNVQDVASAIERILGNLPELTIYCMFADPFPETRDLAASITPKKSIQEGYRLQPKKYGLKVMLCRVQDVQKYGIGTIYSMCASPVRPYLNVDILTPTKEMVFGHKAGRGDIRFVGKFKPVSDVQYTNAYIAILEKNEQQIIHWLESQSTDVTLLCYCPEGDFCHRRILANRLCYLSQNDEHAIDIHLH